MAQEFAFLTIFQEKLTLLVQGPWLRNVAFAWSSLECRRVRTGFFCPSSQQSPAHLTATATQYQQRSRVATQRWGGSCLTCSLLSSVWREQNGGKALHLLLSEGTDRPHTGVLHWPTQWVTGSLSCHPLKGWGTFCPSASILESFAPSSSPTSVNTYLTMNLSLG